MAAHHRGSGRRCGRAPARACCGRAADALGLPVMEANALLASVAGGALIGLGGALLLLFNGRLAAASSVFAGLLRPSDGEWPWRVWFVGGLLAGGALSLWLSPSAIGPLPRPTLLAIPAGLLVGFGTRLGSGCTSGHGVCGISRLSGRSVLATVLFMAAAMLTAVTWSRLAGGPS